MRKIVIVAAGLAALCMSSPLASQQHGVARPNLLLKEHVEGMPKAARQEVRVLTATLNPGERTVYHTHRSPVTIYILQGAFTLEMEGRPPVTAKAGEAMVEPPNVKMTGYNRSATEPMKVVVFYVSDSDTPFLDPIH